MVVSRKMKTEEEKETEKGSVFPGFFLQSSATGSIQQPLAYLHVPMVHVKQTPQTPMNEP